MKRIAIGGSAANPPHNGHLRVLRTIMADYDFDYVIWLPSGTSDYKPEFDVCPDDRVAMTELMIPNTLRLRVQPKLIVRYTDVYGKSRYAYDVLQEVEDTFKTHDLWWFTGTDTQVNTWYRGEELLEEWNVIYIDRAKNSESSSKIRQSISYGETDWELSVPVDVADYIKRNGLYGFAR